MNRQSRHAGGVRALLTSSSVAALLLGGGMPSAFAACAINDVTNSAGPGPFNNTSAINCINIQTSTVNGNVSNSAPGGKTATTSAAFPIGIDVNGSTLTNGAIVNSGTITAMVGLDTVGIAVRNNAMVPNGITNSGTIRVTSSGTGGTAIEVLIVPTFGGGIRTAARLSRPRVS